jgi:mannose-6-phosphate isomerase-like protein (cupin superfamily)
MGGMNMADGLRHVEPGLGEAWWVVGDTYTFKVTGDDTGGALAFFEASVPPQGGPPPHIHGREDEFYYLLNGALQVRDGDRLFTAEPGSFVFVPRGRLHCFRNDSHVPARMLIGITPAGFEKFFFAVGQRAVPGQEAPPLGPEEMARSLDLAPRFGMEVQLPTEP